jgi:hypothetical protein
MLEAIAHSTRYDGFTCPHLHGTSCHPAAYPIKTPPITPSRFLASPHHASFCLPRQEPLPIKSPCPLRVATTLVSSTACRFHECMWCMCSVFWKKEGCREEDCVGWREELEGGTVWGERCLQ